MSAREDLSMENHIPSTVKHYDLLFFKIICWRAAFVGGNFSSAHCFLLYKNPTQFIYCCNLDRRQIQPAHIQLKHAKHLNNKNSPVKRYYIKRYFISNCQNRVYKGMEIKTIVLENNPANFLEMLQLCFFGFQALSAEASKILPQYNSRTPKNYEEVRLSAQHCRDWSSSKFYGHGNKFLSTYHGQMKARRLYNSWRTANCT